MHITADREDQSDHEINIVLVVLGDDLGCVLRIDQERRSRLP